MRKGGQHKPLILDKFSAEDLNTGFMKYEIVKQI